MGTDRKMLSCCRRLRELGFKAECCDSTADFREKAGRNRNIVLPLPALKNNCIAGTGIALSDFCAALSEKNRVFCSNISPDNFLCEAVSYYSDREFIRLNSCLTAQGTLKIVLDNIEKDISTLSAAVIGYGSCGREICRIFRNNGLKVTVFSHTEKSASAAASDGMRTAETDNINLLMNGFDIIINTVPVNIINQDGLDSLNSDTLYIEIASAPYGFNTENAEIRFRYVTAGGLPGKYTPVGAGINIADTIARLVN